MHNSIIISLSNHIWPNRTSLNALLNIATISLMELWVIAINIAVAVGRLLASVVRFVSRPSLFDRMRFQILKFYVFNSLRCCYNSNEEPFRPTLTITRRLSHLIILHLKQPLFLFITGNGSDFVVKFEIKTLFWIRMSSSRRKSSAHLVINVVTRSPSVSVKSEQVTCIVFERSCSRLVLRI